MDIEGDGCISTDAFLSHVATLSEGSIASPAQVKLMRNLNKNTTGVDLSLFM